MPTCGLALALDEVATAGRETALVLDVARAVPGGAPWQALRMADVALSHWRTSIMSASVLRACGPWPREADSGWE